MCLTAALLAACESPTAPGDGGSLRLRTVAAATVSNRSQHGLRTVVRDEARWAVVWRQIWGDGAPGLPAVDFESEMVILASATPVCFSAVRVESVEPSDGALRVALTEAAESTCLCAVPETTFHAVRLRRIEGPVEFQIRATPPTCPS